MSFQSLSLSFEKKMTVIGAAESDLLDEDQAARGLGKAMLIVDNASLACCCNQMASGRACEAHLSDQSDACSTGSENASILSIPIEKLKIKFDVVRTRIVEEKRKKYVLYVVVVTEARRFDTDRTILERRYSDFRNLHKGLKSECPSAVSGVSFPKKQLQSKNFDREVMETRSRQFEKYLSYVYHQEGTSATTAFRDFFYTPHLRQATMSLRCEDYVDCYDLYKTCLHLQRKLGDRESEVLKTQCSLVEVCRSMKKYDEADHLAVDALDKLQYDLSRPYLMPLIRAALDVRRKLMMDSSWLKMKLAECEALSKNSDLGVSLREIVVRWH